MTKKVKNEKIQCTICGEHRKSKNSKKLKMKKIYCIKCEK